MSSTAGGSVQFAAAGGGGSAPPPSSAPVLTATPLVPTQLKLSPTPSLTSSSSNQNLQATDTTGQSSSMSMSSPSTSSSAFPGDSAFPTSMAPSQLNSLSVPPADFDWENSGLTNPLKGASLNSALLDVDFLSANGTGTGGGISAISTLQRELDELGLSSTTAANQQQKSPTTQKSLLDELMSSAAAQRPKYKQPAELSLDARALHDQLPDITYLKASMIMFPIGMRRHEQNGE